VRISTPLLLRLTPVNRAPNEFDMKMVEGPKGMLQIDGGRRRRPAEIAEPLEIYPTNNTSNSPLPSPRKNRILRKTNEQGSKTQGEGRAIALSDPLPPPTMVKRFMWVRKMA
jgi:hypothetical protein